MAQEVPKKILQAIPVPDYLLAEQNANKKALTYGALTAIGLLGIRTMTQIWTDPQHFASNILLFKAYADQLLGGAQMPLTPSGLTDPGLLTLDTLAGVGLPIVAAGLVTAGTALSGAIHKKENIRKEILAKGDIDHPLGLMGHTVVMGQVMPFFNEILSDIKQIDHTDPFLISKTGPSQFNPYEHKGDGDPATRYWKSSVNPYDDKTLVTADLDNSLRMIIMMPQTDNLILSTRGEVGLQPADVGNIIATAYRLKPELQTLLVVPSTEVLEEGFFDTLIQNGVPIDNVKTIIVDQLLEMAIHEKMARLGITSFDLNVGDYAEKYNKFFKQANIPINTEGQYQIIYEKDDSQVLWKAREARGKGKKPLAIFDTSVQVSEAKGRDKNTDIEYICIEELVRSATKDFINNTKPDIKNYQLDTPISLKALVYNNLEPILVQKGAATIILQKAIQAMGESDFFRLLDEIQFATISNNLHIQRLSPTKMSYRSHNQFFDHFETTHSGRYEYTQKRRNTWIMKQSMNEHSVERLTPSEILERFFGAKVADKEIVQDFNAVIQSLYVLGYLYKEGKEFVRYPIKNSVIKDHFQELGIIEVLDK